MKLYMKYIYRVSFFFPINLYISKIDNYERCHYTKIYLIFLYITYIFYFLLKKVLFKFKILKF